MDHDDGDWLEFFCEIITDLLFWWWPDEDDEDRRRRRR
jgi:hypothetical protein